MAQRPLVQDHRMSPVFFFLWLTTLVFTMAHPLFRKVIPTPPYKHPESPNESFRLSGCKVFCALYDLFPFFEGPPR